MNKYDVATERDGWHRVTRNGRIIRAYLPFPAQRSEISTRPDGYNLFMFRKDAAAAARVRDYNELHALLVAAGKHHCRPSAPQCAQCPLRPLLPRAVALGGVGHFRFQSADGALGDGQ